MKIGFGKAHGKIILIGEHAVVYGTRAIAIPFFKTTVVTKVFRNDENYIKSSVYTGKLASAPSEIEAFKSLINELTLKFNLPPMYYEIESNIPISSGMGSSAAIASSIVEAIYDFLGISLTDKSRFEWTQFSERIAHGNPSGIDALTTTHDFGMIFQKSYGPVKFPYYLNGYLIVGESGEKGNTKEAVSAVKRLIEEEDKKHLINQIGIEVEACYEAYLEKDIDKIGHSLIKTQKKLRELEVSTKTIDTMVEIAMDKGAVGSKLTGGGRGGCVIALAKDLKTANNIKEAWVNYTKQSAWILNLNEE